tara:strand:- start:2624 stop:2887 length:264 start_codon:yes stop_codon:yes gene_type:complete
MSDDIEIWKQRNEILHKKVERLMEEVRQEHKLRQEAEGELAIIKATTIFNSPEMRDIRKELNEVREDNKKLALQVNELEDRVRDSNF